VIGLLATLGKAAGQLAVQVVTDLLDRAAKRVTAVQERKEKPAAAQAPIGSDKYTTGLLDGIQHERARQLEQRMTELARKQLDERSDEK
jgi:hypothetical protein